MDRPSIVNRFNEGINARDISVLESLMSEGHAFIDTAGNRYDGKEIALKAWRGFFDLFPDYQNHFEQLIDTEDSVVVIGRSTCSEKALEGPGLWTVRLDGDKISEWRVYHDTPEVREAIKIEPGNR
jgi:ketosteroid isomerase-like protein